ncbi:porin [Polynucleobacter kasalickyi]|uniref:Outer membrane protein (Porin) n=1 Tax=Polynucleobacter kasalickyi TaxID=1938817 RepID=A0A1W2BYX7_9BURK|nr:porin [Polynucleobacter kasalickyi]SMC78061.1 Outer membrane protein (porin) [Polynucleobacter kasalickyi]
MKKSLFALAALSAFAGAAQAQSSVTLYGTIDVALTYINNAGLATGASGTTSTSTPTATGNALAMTDYGIFSNVWGLKGEEDLGGGLKAIFNLEGDINALNGSVYKNTTTGIDQIFRRSANVGLAGTWGEVRLGQQGNPLVAASANLVPVEGNSVNLIRSAAGYSMGDYMSNAISYQSPNLNGLRVKAAYSASQQVDDATGGSAFAANAFYNLGGLMLTAGYNQQNAMNNLTGSALSSSNLPTTDISSTAWIQNSSKPGDLKGYVLGARYKVSPTFEVGYGFGHADYNSGTSLPAASAAKTYNSVTHIVGLGYNASPALLLGLNYAVTNSDSSLYNAQARYSLSKRTMLYAQVGVAKNGAGSYAGSTTAYGNFQPVQVNTSQNPTAVTGYAALPNTTQTSVGLGVVHNF